MRKLLLAVGLLVAGCDDSDETVRVLEQRAQPPRVFVQPQPPPVPAIPVVEKREPAQEPEAARVFVPQVQPSFSQRAALQHSEERTTQVDLLAGYQKVYSDYAAAVAKLEQQTAHIPAKDVKHRRQYYWAPLNQYAENLQIQYQITGYQLAQIVNQGHSENWPTKDTRDGAAVARMFRRIRAEETLIVRHAVARANMAMLDALVDSVVQQASVSASTPGRSSTLSAPGYHGMLPPIYTGPPIGVRIGQPTISPEK
jgi:hypothetical protein